MKSILARKIHSFNSTLLLAKCSPKRKNQILILIKKRSRFAGSKKCTSYNTADCLITENRRGDFEKYLTEHEKKLKDLEIKIRMWNNEYNNMEHRGLNGKTSNEMLQLLTINEPTNVCG